MSDKIKEVFERHSDIIEELYFKKDAPYHALTLDSFRAALNEIVSINKEEVLKAAIESGKRQNTPVNDTLIHQIGFIACYEWLRSKILG